MEGNYCMKKTYEAPAVEVVVFDVEEALSTSGAGGNIGSGGIGGDL